MNNKKYWVISVITLLLSLVFLIRIEVVLVKYEQGHLLITSDFTLGWIHSVEKEPWYESYTMDTGQLVLKETYFKTFGAGTPSEGEFIETDDGYIHFLMNKPVSEINMIVSDNVQVTVHTKNNKIELFKLAEDYTNFSFTIQRVSLWKYLRGEKYD